MVGRDADRRAAGHLNRHFVIEIEGHRQDDVVAGRGDRENRVHERHVAAGRHHHAAVLCDVDAVVATELLFDRADERAVAEPVLIFMRVGIRHGLAGDGNGSSRRPEMHHALTERNGARRLANEIADDLHDGRLNDVHPGA